MKNTDDDPQVPEILSFTHPEFHQDCPHTLDRVKRKSVPKKIQVSIPFEPMNAMKMLMNVPVDARTDAMHTLNLSHSQGRSTADVQALESQVKLLMQKAAGYEKEVEELKMRQEELEGYVRSVEERLKRGGQRCYNGEILSPLSSIVNLGCNSF
jgi:hypothetical protein